jgi:hypothetical protein
MFISSRTAVLSVDSSAVSSSRSAVLSCKTERGKRHVYKGSSTSTKFSPGLAYICQYQSREGNRLLPEADGLLNFRATVSAARCICCSKEATLQFPPPPIKSVERPKRHSHMFASSQASALRSDFTVFTRQPDTRHVSPRPKRSGYHKVIMASLDAARGASWQTLLERRRLTTDFARESPASPSHNGSIRRASDSCSLPGDLRSEGGVSRVRQ